MSKDIMRIKEYRKRNAGLSLLEIMIVLAIIALVAGLTAPRIINSFGRAKSQAAKVQFQNIKAAVEMYYIDVGSYPSEAVGLRALVEAPSGASNWFGPYIEQENDILDPWGRPFLYRYPGRDGGFDLISYGKDGREGGDGEDADILLNTK